jgi:two-component system KDP operon response regulator KdpE
MDPIALDPAPIALVVDDEPAVRGLMSMLLARRGWSVVQAADGASALSAAAEQRLSLLVTDYDMPVLNGLDLAARLRRFNGRLPILMVSGHPDAAARILELAGGRTALAAKPFLPEEFLSQIDALVARA